METKLVVFKDKQIRRTMHNNEWWFSVADVIEELTDSSDVRQYVKKMRQRDPELDSYWVILNSWECVGANCPHPWK